MWDSGIQHSGFVFTQTFSTIGTFPYFCKVHGGCCGIIASVTVTDKVQITRAVYTRPRRQLSVQSTDTNSSFAA